MKLSLPLAGLLAALSGCSDDDNGEPLLDAGAVLRYGDACSKDSECTTKLCAEGVCSKECSRLSDCPSVQGKGFDCGEISSGKVACYPRKYETKKAGTMGHDCSITSCASGYLCTGQQGDADRYCAAKCTSDRDCPPRYRCATMKTGKSAAQSDRYCMRREFCHPCIIDDQCGETGNRCLKDTRGNRFCSKACTKLSLPEAGLSPDADATSGSCPSYAACVLEGGSYQCRHKAGYCYRSFKSEGEQCDPCIFHGWLPTTNKSDPLLTIAEDGQCRSGGFCMILSRYTYEAACVMPCDSSGKCVKTTHGCLDRTTSLGTKVCVPVTKDSSGYTIIGSCF